MPVSLLARLIHRSRDAMPPAGILLEVLLLLVAYAGFTVWWLWPLPLGWRTHSAYFGAEYGPSVADFYLIVWALAWNAHALTVLPYRPFHANIL